MLFLLLRCFYQFLLQNCAFALSYRKFSFNLKFYFLVFKAINNGLFPLIQNNLKCQMHFFPFITMGINLLILIRYFYILKKLEFFF
jgi:hypothetical protein